jgi:hypothetical protein
MFEIVGGYVDELAVWIHTPTFSPIMIVSAIDTRKQARFSNSRLMDFIAYPLYHTKFCIRQDEKSKAL